MNIINVNASKDYRVIVGFGILHHLGEQLRTQYTDCKVAVVTDSNVAFHHLAVANESLTSAGFQVHTFAFPAGEPSKTADTFLQILNFLADNHFTRSDLIIALGGGVVGDITGFAAACYLRGIPYIQIPTTLLAMVDSSVGGKTAIDLPAGKNLAGAFYQPAMVLCDIDTLATLPEDVFRDGCAEVIKYGILYDCDLFAHLSEKGFNFDRQYVITRCIELKRDVVAEDEFDTGLRQKLNLGHTIGHAIEANSSYQITHGSAVAAGIAIISRAAAAWQHCTWDTSRRIISVLSAFHLPTKCPFSSEQLYHSMLSDKKRFGKTVNLIIPNAIGNCNIIPVAVEQLQSFIEAGM